MIIKLYWVPRILGYLTSLGGIFYYLAHLQGPDPAIPKAGLNFVYAGFVFFFVSYACRAYLRFSPRRRPSSQNLPP